MCIWRDDDETGALLERRLHLREQLGERTRSRRGKREREILEGTSRADVESQLRSEGARRALLQPENAYLDRLFSDDVVRALDALPEEFRTVNQVRVQAEFEQALAGLTTIFEPHVDLKKRVPGAIGLIRTGDTIQYANMILESA